MADKDNRGQIILRIEDHNGYHIVRKHESGWRYTQESYKSRPENYLNPPLLFMPLTEDEVAEMFTAMGKEFRREAA